MLSLSMFGLPSAINGLVLRIRNGLSTESQDRLASPSASSEKSGREKEEGAVDTARSEEVRQMQREIEGLKELLEGRGADMVRLSEEIEELTEECRRREDRIAKLVHENGQIRRSYQVDMQMQIQDIQTMEERLRQTREQLAAKSDELTGAYAFLSTTDHLSEAEVLDIVRDLNENIYQVAVNLTEEWEGLEPSQATSRMNVYSASRLGVPTLVQRVLDHDPTGLTFLLQSCLCSQVAKMTSSWGYHQDLAILESIYKRLSASEGQSISARWRALTHSYLTKPPPDSGSIVEQLANILYETGSFSSTQQSLELVKAVALEGIESIIQLAMRLEFAFLVEVTSSEVFLLYGIPGTRFDDVTMTDEFGSGSTYTHGRQDEVAGTTEVGVGKSICGKTGEDRRMGILLKTKVVLEKDVVGL